MDTRTGGARPNAGSAVGGLTERPRSGWTDAVGALVLAGCAVWSLIAAAGRPARPEGVLLAILAVAAGYAAGRIGGALRPVAVPAVAALTAVLLVVAPPGRLSGGPDTPPLGYANADAALMVLATGAACCAAWSARSRPLRVGLRLLGAAAAGFALAVGSAAGFAACLGVVLCSLAADRMRRALGLAGLALALVVAVGGTCAVAVDALPPGLSASLSGQLTPARVRLWHDALETAREHPVRGIGPGRFAEAGAGTAPSAAGAGTPRSAPLQLAAEQGVPGVALLGASCVWLLWALQRSPRPAPVVLTAAAALTGLAMQSAVDHVLGYPVVTAGAGLLAGLATSRPLSAAPDHGVDRP
ncbi:MULTISPECIES: O-antigen ligase family protein [Streptomycetaceae]|uniref:O-antigen ligase family protein n=1 Tax=Streptomycetaceae TaxID=2062 RepID=UPI00131A052B|nr:MULTISPECIES: O-antigen ligase family protein [Streptomycetaceae]MYX37191.1 O-antigen polymerase [Streptomyces sp. SID8377]